MTPLVKRRLYLGSGGGGTPPVEPPVEPPPTGQKLTGAAVNGGKRRPGTGHLPYLNLYKHGCYPWASSGTRHTTNGFGGLVTLTPGVEANRWMFGIPGVSVPLWLKDGNYTMKWDGPSGGELSVRVTGEGVSGGTRASPNTYTFNFANPGGTGVSWYFYVTNNRTGTGAANFAITNIRCVYTPYLSLHDVNGLLFCPDYAACMPDHMIAYRNMDPAEIGGNNGSSVIEMIRPIEAEGWGWDTDDWSGPFYTGEPFEVSAEFCKQMNCDLHCNVPIQGNQAMYDAIGARLWAHLSSRPDISVIIAVGNENWDGGGSSQWLRTYASAPANVARCQDNQAFAEAERTLIAARGLLNAGFPRNRVIVTAELQLYGNWNINVDGYGGWMMRYVDTLGLVKLNARYGDIVDRVVTAGYQHFQNPAWQDILYAWKLLSLDWTTITDAEILQYLQNSNNEMSGVIDARVSDLRLTTGRDIPIGSYEGGSEVTYFDKNYAGTYPHFKVDAANNKIVFTAEYATMNFTDGDLWYQYETYVPPAGNWSNYVGPTPPTCASTLPIWTPGYIRRVDATGARFYTTKAAATATYANDAAAKAASIVLDQPASGQEYIGNDITRRDQFLARFDSFSRSPAAGTAMANMLAATIGTTKLRYPCNYIDIGGWPQGDGYNAWWGLKAGKYAPPIQRHIVYKQFAG
jgi:hypothetical protein